MHPAIILEGFPVGLWFNIRGFPRSLIYLEFDWKLPLLKSVIHIQVKYVFTVKVHSS